MYSFVSLRDMFMSYFLLVYKYLVGLIYNEDFNSHLNLNRAWSSLNKFNLRHGV